MTAAGGEPVTGGNSLRWLVSLARPLRGRLVVAALTGALATGCGVALLAVSGFLLARASQHPDIAALSVAVVAVRALSIGRGGFRYAERLASHDAAFRVLARVRVAIWRRLEAVAPAGLPAFGSGDLLARLVSDVDASQDLFIRGLNPLFAAVLVGCGAVLTCLALVGRAGVVLAAGLVVGIVAVPVLCLRDFPARQPAGRDGAGPTRLGRDGAAVRGGGSGSIRCARLRDGAGSSGPGKTSRRARFDWARRPLSARVCRP